MVDSELHLMIAMYLASMTTTTVTAMLQGAVDRVSMLPTRLVYSKTNIPSRSVASLTRPSLRPSQHWRSTANTQDPPALDLGSTLKLSVFLTHVPRTTSKQHPTLQHPSRNASTAERLALIPANARNGVLASAEPTHRCESEILALLLCSISVCRA